MARISRQLRSRLKLITTWLMLFGLACFYWLDRYCLADPNSLCAITVETILNNIPLILFFSLTWVGYCLYHLFKRKKEVLLNDEFRYQPHHYNGKIVALYGRVEKILKDRTSERIKRKVTDLYRKAMKNNDSKNRFVHQRFLISSPQLRQGYLLMVHHNTSYGKQPLKRRNWVKLRGIYSHDPKPIKRGVFQQTTFYGVVHHTHEPEGFLTVLTRKKPVNIEQTPIEISESLSSSEKE